MLFQGWRGVMFASCRVWRRERVEQSQLLMTVRDIESVIDIQHDLLGRASKGSAVKSDHLMRHPGEHPCVGRVLHSRDRGLRAQRRPCLGIRL